MDKYRDEYIGKTALVTGGAGCIGSNLVKALVEAGAAKVVVVDDLSSAALWNVPVHPHVVFFEGSILEPDTLNVAFYNITRYAPVDFVFHLAAHFANQNSVDNPETDLLVNGMGTLKALERARQASVGRFVFASSGCSVYGSEAPLPLKEDFVSLHLDTPYQITKLLGELYCNFYHNYYGLPVAIARYFNVYGPGEIPGQYRNVIPNFIWKAMHGETLPITGTGEETRDFTYVDDIVDGTLRLGVAPEAVGEAINLASGTERLINSIATIINDLTGNEGGVEFVPTRRWDKIVRRRAAINKARDILGYEPSMGIVDGIKATYQWIEANRSAIQEAIR